MRGHDLFSISVRIAGVWFSERTEHSFPGEAMTRRNLALTFWVLLLAVGTAFGQDFLTNKSVLDMVAAGLPDEIIIARIKSSKTGFDLSTPELAKLTQAKVSTAVIKAMIEPKPGDPGTVAGAVGTASANPNDPDAPHEAGIYLFSDKGVKQMTPLEPTVYTQSKMGGVWKSAVTYGIAKAKFKAVVSGAHANVKTLDSQPVFYFYFEEKSAGLSRAGGATTSPNEFTLLRFDTKGEVRETVVGEFNAWGSSTGTDQKATSQFKHEKLRPGVFKVTIVGSLQPGEYCFLSSAGIGAFGAGAAGANRLWDFRIVAAE
jgi:hypothetical protein